ncbi:MAG: AAC(3) family N-acetyltransferase, partial [Deinococcota bacterium]|nr:AAC(3) family N-acetyltransferase [Deinococcota bacterium]
YGSDGGTLPERTPKRVYSPGKSEIDREMGAVPAAIIAMPERVRGDHPLNSFSASGPLAQDLIAGQSGLDVYAPLRRLRELGGAVVLMGVGLTRMTLLHLAEAQAGPDLFVRWANGRDGKPVGVRVGGCSEGFERLVPALAGLERKLTVGDSLWRVYPARETLERAAAAIRAHPEITRCGDPACVRCSDAVRGGPVLEAPYLKTVDLKTVERTWR